MFRDAEGFVEASTSSGDNTGEAMIKPGLQATGRHLFNKNVNVYSLESLRFQGENVQHLIGVRGLGSRLADRLRQPDYLLVEQLFSTVRGDSRLCATASRQFCLYRCNLLKKDQLVS